MIAVQLKVKKSSVLLLPILSLVYLYMSMFLGHRKKKLSEMILGIVYKFRLTH